MTAIGGRPWDMYRAELADTMRAHNESPRPCVYCSKPTTSRYRVCLDHSDLLDLDPQAPAALDEDRAAQPPDADDLPQGLASPPALFSSSAAAHGDGEPDRTNGDQSSGTAAALDNLETPWAAS